MFLVLKSVHILKSQLHRCDFIAYKGSKETKPMDQQHRNNLMANNNGIAVTMGTRT